MIIAPAMLQEIGRRMRSATMMTVARTAGVESAMRLVYERGGHRLTVPRNSAGSVLEKVVGIDAALSLCDAYANEIWEIPHERHALALWLRSQNYSIREIAHVLRVSPVRVRVLLSEGNRRARYWTKSGGPCFEKEENLEERCKEIRSKKTTKS